MRYFILLLLVFCISCGLSNRHTAGQEKNVAMKDTARSKTEPVADSRIHIDTIPGLAAAAKGYAFDPSMIVMSASSSAEHPWLFTSMSSVATSWNPPFDFNLSSLHITSPVLVTVDSVSFPPPTFADTISAAPVKFIPKSTTTILPESKSSVTPYIGCGIAAIILFALFFARKRLRKTK
jgi:hypothetical protein